MWLAIHIFNTWNYSNTHGDSIGENNFTVMLVASMWNIYGDFLEGPGWTNALESYHQVMQLLFWKHHILQALARHLYQVIIQTPACNQHEIASFSTIKLKRPTLQYSDTILNMELLELVFIQTSTPWEKILNSCTPEEACTPG